MTPVVPGVEVTDDRHGLRIRSPNREAGAADAIDGERIGPQGERQLEQPPLVEQMKIRLA